MAEGSFPAKQQSLFESASATRTHRRRGLLRRLGAIVAPIAADAGSVIDDERYLDAARAIARAFQDGETSGGLTKNQILERVGWQQDGQLVEERFNVLLKLEMLQPILDKRHQDRYVLNPAGLAGLLMFERARERGGIDEVLLRLGRTRAELARELLTEDELARRMDEVRGTLKVYADDLHRLVRTASLPDLVDARSQNDEQVVTEVQALCQQVSQRFPQLDPLATRLVESAFEYMAQLRGMLNRLLEEGGRAGDFSLLSPEEYMSAAIDGTEAALARVFEEVAFDPASPWVDATSIIEALQEYRPQTGFRRPPPEEPPLDTADPLERIARLQTELTARQRTEIAIRLGGADRGDVTPSPDAADWTVAAGEFSKLLAADINREVGFRLRFGDALRVDPESAVTYASPVELVREGAKTEPQLVVIEGGGRGA